jgi:hypothetical protein
LTVTGQIFWNGVLLWPLAPPVPGGGGAAAAAAIAALAALQQGVPACRQPLSASGVAIDPGNSLCPAAAPTPSESETE